MLQLERLARGVFEHEGVERPCLPRTFDDGDEVGRGHEAAAVLPANQRLGAAGAAIGHPDLRLKDEDQPAAAKSAAEAPGQRSVSAHVWSVPAACDACIARS